METGLLVRLVLAELFRPNQFLWYTEVAKWLQPKQQQDTTWLQQVVANHQTQVRQFIVDLLDDEATTAIVADYLDRLMAFVPVGYVYIARYPVTNAQYRRFVKEGGYDNQKWWSKDGWRWLQNLPHYRPNPVTQPAY